MANGGVEFPEAFDIFDMHFKLYNSESLGTRKERGTSARAAHRGGLQSVYPLHCHKPHGLPSLREHVSGPSCNLRHMVKDGVVYTGQPLYGKDDER